MSFRHFKSLLFRSAQIDIQIEREQVRPWPDWIRLLKLKKLRLILKDRIHQIVLERKQPGYPPLDQFRAIPAVAKSRRN